MGVRKDDRLRLKALTANQRREVTTSSLSALAVIKRSAPLLPGGVAVFTVNE